MEEKADDQEKRFSEQQKKETAAEAERESPELPISDKSPEREQSPEPDEEEPDELLTLLKQKTSLSPDRRASRSNSGPAFTTDTDVFEDFRPLIEELIEDWF